VQALLSFALVALLPAQQPDPVPAPSAVAAAPCDDGLTTAATPQPVFVRMRDQLFAIGGEYEAFCTDNATAPRSQVRKQALADLHRKAEQSWQQVQATVTALLRSGELHSVQRFWIVNGFAADATGTTVKQLAALPAVGSVHRQTQPDGVQHRTEPHAARWLADRQQDEQQALAMQQAQGDEGPFTAEGLVIPWNLQTIRADAAWQLGAHGEGVVIALLDTGVLGTEPLVQALWRNPHEQQDGKDDDGNGLVDDLFGWDFTGDTRFVVGDGPQSHGTMCGGILAGRPWGVPRTVTGVAPRARLMVLRGMGSLRAYEYAATMGAQVLSMSYMWIDVELGSYRGVFRTAHEHLAACGITAVGGAGNFARTAPAGRQIALPKDIPCVIAAAGIGRDGTVPPFSSRGPCTWDDVPWFHDFPASAPLHKPDVTGCSSGFPVWHWTAMPSRQVEVVWQDERGIGLILGPQGNSFAGPHAGGVAALMLSANPELTPWRVQALMLQTCKDLGAPGWDPIHGAGLLQADAAVAAAKAAKVQ